MEAIEAYRIYLERQPISAHTRRNYLQRVKCYLQWLTGSIDGYKALTDPIERDFQLREFKVHLLQTGAKPNTVNAALSAVDNFYLSIGLGSSKIKRLDLPQQAPRALEPSEETRLRKAIARADQRNRTLIVLLLNSGLRISEVAALNISDVKLTARLGEILVRCGKGLKQRVIPINDDLREVLISYMSGEAKRGEGEPLFLSRKKRRLSVNSIDRIVRQIGREAGIELSAHDCRHDFITKLIRLGTDIVAVAELAGHARLETVRRYSLPTAAVKQQAVERLCNAS